MKTMLFILAILFCFSCSEEKQPEQNTATENSMEFSDSINVETNRQIILSPEATNMVSQWLAYVTAQNEIEDMRNATGTELVQNSQPLVQIMEALRTTMPDSLQVPAVEARTNVLLTKAVILHQFSSKKDKKAEEIFDVANDIIVEFDNFKLQLNELFLKAPEDFELELDREFEEAMEQDTILPEPLEREQI